MSQEGLGESLLASQSRPASPERGGARLESDGALSADVGDVANAGGSSSAAPSEQQQNEAGPGAVSPSTHAGAGAASPSARAGPPRTGSVTERPERDAADAQLSNALAVCVEGMPQPKFDGVYERAGEHAGWPRFKNAAGAHLFRYIDGGEWFLHDSFDPSAPRASAHIRAADGPLPIGEQPWLVWMAGKWTSVPLTVSLLATAGDVQHITGRYQQRQQLLKADAQWDPGDFTLAAGFLFVGMLLFAAAVTPGFQVAAAAGCNSASDCYYSPDSAVDGHNLEQLVPLVVTNHTEKSRQEEDCCQACKDHPACIASTYLGAAKTCLLYSDHAGVVAFEGATACVLPPDDASASSAVRAELETLVGASALLVRFGGFALLYLIGRVMGLIGYGGASIGQSVLMPRRAGVVAAAVAGALREQGESDNAAVPLAASWEAIAVGAGPPPSWTAARRALRLSVRQAVLRIAI